MKPFLFFLIVGLTFLGACSPEKAPVNKEVTTIKEVTLSEQKIAMGKQV